MRLTRADEALYAGVRAMLQRVAEGDSLDLVKKILQLEGLVKCLQRGAEEEPDLIDALFTMVKDPLTRGKKMKKEQQERKRQLDRERAQENRERAKRLKSSDIPTDRTSTSTSTAAQGLQCLETRDMSAQPVDRRSPTRSEHESQRSHPTLDLETAQQGSEGNEEEEDRNDQKSRTSSEASSDVPLRPRDSNGRGTIAATQRPNSPSCSSRSSSDDEDEADTANTKKEEALASKEAPPSARLDHVGTSTGEEAEATISDTFPSTQTTQATPLTAANLARLPPSTRATASEAVHQREVALACGDQAQKEILKGHLLQHVWPRFQHRSNVKNHEQDAETILAMAEDLNFWKMQSGIHLFGKKRMESPRGGGGGAVVARISELAGNPDPVAVFHAIEASSSTEHEARLHKVYAQVRLVRCITRKIDDGYRPKEAKLLPRTTRKQYPKFFLSDMADGMCAGEPKEMRDKKWVKLQREYNAGRRWLETMETFKGEGIAFVIVFAGELKACRSPYGHWPSLSLSPPFPLLPQLRLTPALPEIPCELIARCYNAFQRACMEFVFTWIPSVSRLIKCFGKDALDSFCRLGRLEEGTLNRIRDCEGPEIAPPESVDEMDEGSA